MPPHNTIRFMFFSFARSWLVMLAALLLAMLAGITTGRVTVEWSFFWRWLTSAGAFAPGSTDATAYAVITSIRLPRAALAVVAGAGLAMAGAALQGTLRNPLAGPQTVGVIGGAGAGGRLYAAVRQRRSGGRQSEPVPHRHLQPGARPRRDLATHIEPVDPGRASVGPIPVHRRTGRRGGAPATGRRPTKRCASGRWRRRSSPYCACSLQACS